MFSTATFSADTACLLLEQEGYRAKLESIDGKSVGIRSGTQGIDFSIIFAHLDEENGFGMILMQSLIEPPEGIEWDASFLLDDLNDVNKDTVISRAYLQDETRLVLEARIPLSCSCTTSEIFRRFLAAWVIDMRKFAAVLNQG